MLRITVVLAAVLLFIGCAGTAATYSAPTVSKTAEPSAKLSIVTQNPAVGIYVDNKFYGNSASGMMSPAAFSLSPGAYEVRASLPGYVDYVATITLTAGNSHVIIVPSLQPAPGAKAARLRDEQRSWSPQDRYGRIALVDIPQASSVYVDGELHGQVVKQGEVYYVDVPFGRHEIAVARPSGPYHLTVYVTMGREQQFLVGDAQAPPASLHHAPAAEAAAPAKSAE